MKDYIKPPRLSTSFSKNGIKVRNRFANILDMRKKSRGIIALMLIVSISLMFGGCFLEQTTVEDESTDITIIGMDASGERSDVILLASMDGDNLTVTQIPRDTYVNFNGGTKIGALSEPTAIKTCVRDLTGAHGAKYIKVDYDGLKNMVDAIGGIDFNVPMDMQYSDPYQDLEINLKAGEQHLDGEMLEMLIRYRMSNPDEITGIIKGYENGDLDRLAVQRDVYTAVAEKLFNNGITQELPKIIAENVDTNLSVSDFVETIKSALKLTPENISFDVLHGEYVDDGSYRSYRDIKMKIDGENVNLRSEFDTEIYVSEVKSARVNGRDYTITNSETFQSPVNRRLNKAVINSLCYVDDNHNLYISANVTNGESSVFIQEGIPTSDKQATEKYISGLTIDAEIIEIPKEGGEVVITDTDTDTQIVLELTPKKIPEL